MTPPDRLAAEEYQFILPLMLRVVLTAVLFVAERLPAILQFWDRYGYLFKLAAALAGFTVLVYAATK